MNAQMLELAFQTHCPLSGSRCMKLTNSKSTGCMYQILNVFLNTSQDAETALCLLFVGPLFCIAAPSAWRPGGAQLRAADTRAESGPTGNNSNNSNKLHTNSTSLKRKAPSNLTRKPTPPPYTHHQQALLLLDDTVHSCSQKVSQKRTQERNRVLRF